MPFESRHTRFGLSRNAWSKVPTGQSVAIQDSISLTKFRAAAPGTFFTTVETIVSADQSRLTVITDRVTRTGLFSYERDRVSKSMTERDTKPLSVKTGTLGRRIKFRPTK